MDKKFWWFFLFLFLFFLRRWLGGARNTRKTKKLTQRNSRSDSLSLSLSSFFFSFPPLEKQQKQQQQQQQQAAASGRTSPLRGTLPTPPAPAAPLPPTLLPLPQTQTAPSTCTGPRRGTMARAAAPPSTRTRRHRASSWPWATRAPTLGKRDAAEKKRDKVGGARKKTHFFSYNKKQKTGHCFHEIRLSEAIDVQNIRVEPDGAAHVFVVRRFFF